VRTGVEITGEGSKRTSMPSASNTTRMSENRIAASTPRPSIGCSVTSAHRSGLRHSSLNETRLRTARYSGM
jgi:hypothetical protein